MPKSFDAIVPIDGLNTSSNKYLIPDGAQSNDAYNWMLRELGKARTRNPVSRRQVDGGDFTTPFFKMFPYKGDIYVLRGDFDFRRYDPDAQTLSGSLYALTGFAATDLKMRAAVATERLFLTSAEGPICVDSATATYARKAGGPIAPSIDPVTSGVSGSSGFLPDDRQVAYRYVLGAIVGDLVILGPPSPRFIVRNESGSSDTVDLTMLLDTELDPNLQYRIFVFRSQVSTLDIQPDDDLRLVYEAQLTDAQRTAGLVDIVDSAVDDLRGEFIYTSPNAGEGILQSNDQPPLVAEVCSHKDRLWGGRSTGKHSYEFSIIGVGGSTGIQDGDELIVTPNITVTAVASPSIFADDYLLTTGLSTAQNIEQTALAMVAAINRLAIVNGGEVWASYISGPEDTPGRIRIVRNDFNTTAFQLQAGFNGASAYAMRFGFSPRLPADLTTTGFSLARVSNVVTATQLGGRAMANALAIGDTVRLNSATGTFGVGPHTVTGVSGATFTYTEVGIDATAAGPVTFTDAAIDSTTSTQEIRVNRLWFSKFREPEAFPLLNFLDIGRSDKSILAMKSTSETLWVFKEDGLFRVFGDDEDTFGVEHVDETIICLCPETVQTLNNRVIAWTNRGVVALDNGSVEYISGPIDETLRSLYTTYRGDAVQPVSSWFAIAHEIDGWYAIFWPDLGAQDQSGDLEVYGLGGAYVWFAETNKWMRWKFQDREVDTVPTHWGFGADYPIVSGCYNPDDSRYYLADYYDTASVEGSIYRETRAPTTWLEPSNYIPGNTLPMRRIAAPQWRHGKAPFNEKRWDEVSFVFETFDYNGGDFTLAMGAVTEQNASGLVTAASNLDAASLELQPIIRVVPFDEGRRGQLLQVALIVLNQKEVTLGGVSFAYEVLSTRTRT